MKLTLLFSDIEGSTRLLTQLGARYGETLSIQRSIMREEFVCAHGHEVGTEGDSFFVVFPTVTDAATAVVAAQRRLAARDWPGGVAVRVRMGLHTGQPVPLDDDYVGLDVHRAARIAATAHGGQVVVSGVTAQLLGEVSVPLSLKDLGWHRLKDIPEPEHIFQLVADGLEQAFPPLRSLGTPTNLPPSPTPIIGRDLELTEIATQFTESEARLVTVTGPGGCGKTRLAIAVAERIGSSRADGVYFVDLATARTSEMVWSAIAETLGIRDDGRSPRSLIGYLRDRDMLLILDNLEQVTDAATVVGDLLTQAPNVVLLATSRRPLRLMGEYQLPVPPLDTPVRFGSAAAASTAGAVALFVHRAQMVRPSFRLTEDNVDDVATICSRLDGMPLAIELAAARAKVLSPHAILARLDRSLELSSTELGRPTRQRTLRQTIGWSVDLLNEDQQRFFRHFGVYGSSCDLEALAAIADTSGDPLDQVAELVDVSLLTILDDPSGEPRVTLLQTVRAYARELLRSAGEWESTARRHAEYYIGVMSELMPRLRTTEYLTTRDRIETELGNVRSALEWSLSMDDRDAGDVMLGFRICHEMSWFWYACGHAEEGRQWLELATERMEAEGPEEMAVLHGLAVILLQQGEQTAAQQLLLRCLEYWRARDDDRETAKELNSLGVVYRNLGDHEHARPLFDEGIARAQRSGDKARLASLYCNLGLLETDIGSPIEAIEVLGRALTLDRELGDSWAEACDRVNLAAARLGAGQIQEATQELRSVAQDVVTMNDDDLTISAIEVLAMLLAESGDARRSGRLFGAAETAREQAGLPRPTVDAAQLNRWLSKPMSQVDEPTWLSYVNQGRLLSGEEAIAAGVGASSPAPIAAPGEDPASGPAREVESSP